MQKFDCLSLECPLFGPHLIEASAGTGKTFSIEHIFVRLILEGVEIEKILVVTFTRAATRELKGRIRMNLEKALKGIETGDSSWSYLKPLLGLEEPARLLSDALFGFDQCQIFTIHGFCFRMFKEFAFEAKVGAFRNPDEGMQIPESLKIAARDFLSFGINASLLCREQVALLFKEFESVEAIVLRMLQKEPPTPSFCFSELLVECKAALQPWRLEEKRLIEDFRELEKNYKTSLKGDFEGQIKALFYEEFFPLILKERGSIFDFLHRKNQKLRPQPIKELHYPGFFDWAQSHIAPLVKQPVFPILKKAFEPILQKVLEEEEHLDPDELLLQMQKAVDNPCFKERVREKYKAVIIDEFQDTDALQWDIFQKVFLESSLRALYLVGDPKQSIYRFRKADIYTYLQARDLLGEANRYLLDTNFRSSKPLIGALNALFDRKWLHLPKIGQTLPYHPVQAGSKIESDFQDGKGAIHFMIAQGESLFEKVFLPYAVKEIEAMRPKRCALLVKDRYQALSAIELLKSRGISAIAKSHVTLGQTDAFRAIVELFDAILSPEDRNAATIVLKGPFGDLGLHFSDYKELLEEKGLILFAKQLVLDEDAMQIFEYLFAWEKKEGFSFEGLRRCLKQLKTLGSDEGGGRRIEVDEEAVQVMTLHISKGLEFDVVFALGLASRSPKKEEGEESDEFAAEKMRQLYVAMTRAKKRLYVPVAFLEKEPDLGTDAPMELFSKYFEGPLQEELEALSKTESISLEKIVFPTEFTPVPHAHGKQDEKPSPLRARSYPSSILSSFTTLAKPQKNLFLSEPSRQNPDVFVLQTMPKGPKTGVEIHELLERIFRAHCFSEEAIHILVEERLKYSLLRPWQAAIEEMIQKILWMPFETAEGVFLLKDLNQFQVEMEFIFSKAPHFIKGVIDLIFYFREKIYFIDWKTNWLEKYELPQLQQAMEEHDYNLQAGLYSEAIRRYFKLEIGGIYYVFVRGCSYINPNK